MKIQRKWALIVAVLLTIASVSSGISSNESGAYVAGEIIGKIALPAVFYYFAFMKKKEKTVIDEKEDSIEEQEEQ